MLSPSAQRRALGLLVFVLSFVVGFLLMPDFGTLSDEVEMTRAQYLHQRPWLVRVYAMSAAVTWLSAWALLLTFVRIAWTRSVRWKLRYSLTRWVGSWIAAAIFLAGLSHACDLLLLRYPLFTVYAYVKIALALVSAVTAFYVVPQIHAIIVVPRDLLQQAADELHALVNQPAVTMQQHRAIMERGLRILNSIVETEDQ